MQLAIAQVAFELIEFRIYLLCVRILAESLSLSTLLISEASTRTLSAQSTNQICNAVQESAKIIQAPLVSVANGCAKNATSNCLNHNCGYCEPLYFGDLGAFLNLHVSFTDASPFEDEVSIGDACRSRCSRPSLNNHSDTRPAGS